MKKLFKVMLVVNLVAMPLIFNLRAQSNACAQAEADAKADVNKTMWIGIGCVAPVLGIVIANVVEPTPPSSRLLGKSKEYIATYTDCYSKKVKSIRTSGTITGCVLGTIGWVACCVLALFI